MRDAASEDSFREMLMSRQAGRRGFWSAAGRWCWLLAVVLLTGCLEKDPNRIRRDHAGLDQLLDANAKIEQLATGMTWAEGPVWIDDGGYLLFTDVPANRIHRWSEQDGVSVFLEPSGYSGPDASAFREPGANGLILGPPGSVLMADSGNREIARLDLASKKKTSLASSYQGKKLNSPNDLVLAPNGAVYFTDPSYGLKGLEESPLKELAYNGVYRRDPNGTVTLIDDRLKRPNGIGLSPDGRTLYVANSDEAHPVWVAYSLGEDGSVSNRRIFADSSDEVAKGTPGVPDGLCIDARGNIFATGPGGLYIFTPDGTRLGRIETGSLVSNCAFGGDGSVLFITSHHRVVRVPTKTRGLRF